MSAIRAISFSFLIAAVAVAIACSDSESTADKTSRELLPLPEPQISGAKPLTGKVIGRAVDNLYCMISIEPGIPDGTGSLPRCG